MYTLVNRLFLLLFFTTGFSTLLAAQESGNGNGDSLQRVIMKDSLNVNDKIITQVFSIRDNFLLKSAQIDGNTSLTEQQKKDAKQTLANETNMGIKKVLGDTTYEHYLEMIRRRMPSRLKGKTVQPLASQGN